MTKKNQKKANKDKLDQCIELLQDLFILELGREKIPQQKIREIVRVDITKVNRILKNLKK